MATTCSRVPTRATPAAHRQAPRPSTAATSLSSRSSAALRGGAPSAALSPRSSSSRAAAAAQRGGQPAIVAAAAAGNAGTVAVAGATGLVGTALVKQLLASGYGVRVLTRNVVAARGKLPYPGIQFVAPQQWSEAVCGCTAVVNLAGGRMAADPTAGD